MTSSWVVVVPVKTLDVAKSRLSADLGGLRPALALAMALDTVAAAVSCHDVRVVVVTGDREVARSAGTLGAEVLSDEPASGINPALSHGALHASPRAGEGIAALAADLPALRPRELRTALHRAASRREAFVPDAAGTGTVLYVASTLEGFRPRFGPGSAAAHAATADRLETHGLSSLRQDVDTIDDLRSAAQLGLNERTAGVVRRLGSGALSSRAVAGGAWGGREPGDPGLGEIRPAS